MNIRELKKDDIPTLVELIKEYKAENGKNAIGSNLIITQLEGVLASGTSTILVALENESLLGYICYHIYNFPLILGKECYISDLLVSASARGSGTGKELIAQVEARAKKKSCVRLILNNPKEAPSYKRGFYSKQGFTQRDNFANFVKECS